jgi:hypothetical protein
VEGEVSEVSAPNGRAWVLSADLGLLETPRGAEGVRLIPASDPYLQKPNRPLLAPDAALRRRVFRPVASPGAVIVDGRLAGLWRARAKGKRVEIAVERLEQIPKSPLEQEAQRIAELRGASEALVAV